MTNWTWAGSLIYPCFDCSYFFFTSALRSGCLFVVLFADLALPTNFFGIHGQGGGGWRCNVSSTHVPAATLWMMQVTSSPRTCPPARQPANQPAKLKKTQFRMVSVEPQKVCSIICGLGTGGLREKSLMTSRILESTMPSPSTSPPMSVVRHGLRCTNEDDSSVWLKMPARLERFALVHGALNPVLCETRGRNPRGNAPRISCTNVFVPF